MYVQKQIQVIIVLVLLLFYTSSSCAAPLGYVSNFKVTSYTSTSIDVEWSPIVGATEYKLSWSTGDVFTHAPAQFKDYLYVFTGESN